MGDFPFANFPFLEIGDRKILADVVQELLVAGTFGFELHLQASDTHGKVVGYILDTRGICAELFHQDPVDPTGEGLHVVVPVEKFESVSVKELKETGIVST